MTSKNIIVRILVIIIAMTALAPSSVFANANQPVRVTTNDLWNFIDDSEYNELGGQNNGNIGNTDSSISECVSNDCVSDTANQQVVERITITRNNQTVAIGDETGVHILQRVLLTQEEIQTLIPYARTPEETRMSPYPNRAMTEQELTAWNQEYDSLGGMNAFELEVLYYANQARINNNFTLFTVCPYLNRAAMLLANLRADFDWSGTHHIDPFYGDPTDRAAAFGFNPRDFGVTHVGENVGGVRSRGSAAINSWMNSAAHRETILNLPNRDNIIGVGTVQNRSILKAS